jgi:hypothetical protein
MNRSVQLCRKRTEEFENGNIFNSSENEQWEVLSISGSNFLVKFLPESLFLSFEFFILILMWVVLDLINSMDLVHFV